MRTLVEFEYDPVDPVVQRERLAVGKRGAVGQNHRELGSLAIVRIEALLQVQRLNLRRIGNQQAGTRVVRCFANLQLVVAHHDLIDIQIRIGDKHRIVIGMRDHLAVFGETDDDVVDKQTFECARDRVGRVELEQQPHVLQAGKRVELDSSLPPHDLDDVLGQRQNGGRHRVQTSILHRQRRDRPVFLHQ